MESRHIRLGYEEAILLKRQLLLCELNLLETAKRVRNYKVFRKKELSTKSKLKSSLKMMVQKLNILLSTLPTDDMPKIRRKRAKRIETIQHHNLQAQLEEIRQKLARLG